MRYQNNLEVLKFLKTGVSFTDYTGFGGLHKNMTDREKGALHALLGYDLYSEVMASCKTAYYTPAEIIKAMYNGIVKMGFKGGKILEPACGHGAFIFNSPDAIKNNSTFYAVELERISAKLTTIICPYAKVINTKFENSQYKDNSFDLVIGNPPYSNQVIYHEDKELNNLVIHHFFVAKSIRLLKENGVLAFVLPTYCLDNVKNHSRHIMHKYGSMLASFRLPENMFDSAKVTVDIVFFIKNKEHYTDFLNTKKIDVKGHKLAINQYYIDNPTNVMGNFDTCNMYGERIGLTVKNHSFKDDIFKKLNSLMGSLPTVLTPKTANCLFSKIDSSIKKLEIADSSLQKSLNNLEIQKIELIRQELMELEKKKQALELMLKKY
jgi:type I restriction-modification system DNA methylase subunit